MHPQRGRSSFFFIGHAFGSLRAGGFLLALRLAKGNIFIGHGFGRLQSVGFVLALGLAKSNKRWPCQRRAFLFCRFRLWPVRVPFSPLLYFLPGAGAFFCFRLRRTFLPPFGKILRRSTVLPWSRISICINTKTPDLALQRPQIGCSFFPKSCGGKNTKNLSALIRSRRCPGRSPRR